MKSVCVRTNKVMVIFSSNDGYFKDSHFLQHDQRWE